MKSVREWFDRAIEQAKREGDPFDYILWLAEGRNLAIIAENPPHSGPHTVDELLSENDTQPDQEAK